MLDWSSGAPGHNLSLGYERLFLESIVKELLSKITSLDSWAYRHIPILQCELLLLASSLSSISALIACGSKRPLQVAGLKKKTCLFPLIKIPL